MTGLFQSVWHPYDEGAICSICAQTKSTPRLKFPLERPSNAEEGWS